MENKTNSKVIDIKEIWGLFIKRLWIAALAAIIAMSAAFVVDKLTWQPAYSSTGTIHILRDTKDQAYNELYYNYNSSLGVVNDCKYIINSTKVLSYVKEEVEKNPENVGVRISIPRLRNNISIQNPEDTRMLEITVQAATPELAKEIVDILCDKSVKEINDNISSEQSRVYCKGTFSDTPCNLTSILLYLIIGLAAVLAVYIVFFIILLFDDTIKTDDDIQKHLGVPILGDIPCIEGISRKRKYGHRYGYGYGYGRNKKTTKEDSEK